MLTTMERLQTMIGFNGTLIRYGNRVLVAAPAWRRGEGNGFEACVYTSIGDEEDGIDFIEARLEHTLTSPMLFSDTGHAIEWALATLTN